MEILDSLFLPLMRLILVMSIGLLVATLIEALHWTRFVSRLFSPLATVAHLGPTAAASFSLAFFSPSSANALLAEAYDKGAMSKRELILANLFNSLPSYLIHLPSLLSLVYAFLGARALVYVGLTLMAAALRTGLTLLAGRILLPAQQSLQSAVTGKDPSLRDTASRAFKRYRKRLLKILTFTVPIYCAVFAMQEAGWFAMAAQFMTGHGVLGFLPPQAIGIVTMSMFGDSSLALSAAAPLLHSGSLSGKEVILALLAGNILSSPMRAFRHQFPSYSGYFNPRVAAELVTVSQVCRAISLILVALVYSGL